MATRITYDYLVANVPIWLYADNRSLNTDMSDVIENAEQELLQRLDHDLFRTIISGKQINAGAPTLDLSAEDPRVLEVRAIRMAYRTNGTVPLERREIERLTMLYPNGRAGQPRFYAEAGGILQYQFFPPPDKAYSLSIAANVEFLPLGPTQQTNVLTDQFPRAMERATLYSGALYMKNPADAATYKGEMEAAVNEANMQIGRRKRDETGTRPTDNSNVGGQ